MPSAFIAETGFVQYSGHKCGHRMDARTSQRDVIISCCESYNKIYLKTLYKLKVNYTVKVSVYDLTSVEIIKKCFSHRRITLLYGTTDFYLMIDEHFQRRCFRIMH